MLLKVKDTVLRKLLTLREKMQTYGLAMSHHSFEANLYHVEAIGEQMLLI